MTSLLHRRAFCSPCARKWREGQRGWKSDLACTQQLRSQPRPTEGARRDWWGKAVLLRDSPTEHNPTRTRDDAVPTLLVLAAFGYVFHCVGK
jgi:hypothetical protein